jgi:hypothetical protein
MTSTPSLLGSPSVGVLTPRPCTSHTIGSTGAASRSRPTGLTKRILGADGAEETAYADVGRSAQVGCRLLPAVDRCHLRLWVLQARRAPRPDVIVVLVALALLLVGTIVAYSLASRLRDEERARKRRLIVVW